MYKHTLDVKMLQLASQSSQLRGLQSMLGFSSWKLPPTLPNQRLVCIVRLRFGATDAELGRFPRAPERRVAKDKGRGWFQP